MRFGNTVLLKPDTLANADTVRDVDATRITAPATLSSGVWADLSSWEHDRTDIDVTTEMIITVYVQEEPSALARALHTREATDAYMRAVTLLISAGSSLSDALALVDECAVDLAA